MTPEALARRAVAAPGFRWLPGTLTLPDELGRTFRVVVDDVLTQATGRILRAPWPKLAAHLPDLTDAATLGAVESLAPWAYLSPVLELGTPNRVVGWVAYLVADDSRISRHDTRADAAIAALEAAPRRLPC